MGGQSPDFKTSCITPAQYTSLFSNASAKFIIIFYFKSFLDEPNVLLLMFISEFLYINI